MVTMSIVLLMLAACFIAAGLWVRRIGRAQDDARGREDE